MDTEYISNCPKPGTENTCSAIIPEQIISAATIPTKVIAGIVAASIISGGAIAGTKAASDYIKQKADKETTAATTQSDIKPTVDDRTYIVEDDRNYVLVDKEDKNVDIVVGTQDMDYGLKGVVENYEIKKDVTTYYYDSVRLLDRTGYSASYIDLLPKAQSNMKSYSDEINSAYSDINAARSGKKLILDSVLTEQANIRALEIAKSGLNFSKRPDGTDYTTIFAENGMNDGTMFEARAYAYSNDKDAVNKILHDYSKEIKNEDIEKIGIGVALEPQNDTYVYVVHLYSPKGSATNIDNSASSTLRYNLVKKMHEVEGVGVKIEQGNEDAYDEIYDIPGIGDIAKTDIPIDRLIKYLEDIGQKTFETIVGIGDRFDIR